MGFGLVELVEFSARRMVSDGGRRIVDEPRDRRAPHVWPSRLGRPAESLGKFYGRGVGATAAEFIKTPPLAVHRLA
jgi:hypothetical protein